MRITLAVLILGLAPARGDTTSSPIESAIEMVGEAVAMSDYVRSPDRAGSIARAIEILVLPRVMDDRRMVPPPIRWDGICKGTPLAKGCM